MPTDQTRVVLILSLIITSHYFSFSAPASPIAARNEPPNNSDSHAALSSTCKSAKPSKEASETAPTSGRWLVAKDLLESLVDMNFHGGMHETRRTGGDPIALYSDDVVYTGAQPKEEG